jgi:hypothetical protein
VRVEPHAVLASQLQAVVWVLEATCRYHILGEYLCSTVVRDSV